MTSLASILIVITLFSTHSIAQTRLNRNCVLGLYIHTAKYTPDEEIQRIAKDIGEIESYGIKLNKTRRIKLDADEIQTVGFEFNHLGDSQNFSIAAGYGPNQCSFFFTPPSGFTRGLSGLDLPSDGEFVFLWGYDKAPQHKIGDYWYAVDAFIECFETKENPTL